jgi:hypothetical protein
MRCTLCPWFSCEARLFGKNLSGAGITDDKGVDWYSSRVLGLTESIEIECESDTVGNRVEV